MIRKCLFSSFVLALAACDGDKPPASQVQPPAAPALKKEGAEPSKAAALLRGGGSYEVVEVASPGSLSVTVVFSGDPIPEPAEVAVDTDAEFCGHKVFTEDLLVDKATRGLKNVVVRLEGITRGKAPPDVVTVANRSCSFDPHVSVAAKGTKIQLENADKVLHTTRPFLGGSSLFNASLPAGEAPPPPRPIPRTGVMEITCDVHKWMRGYVYVHTNPYAAVTDKSGALQIDGIPPGKYTYVAWHEGLGEKKGEVEIVAGKQAELKLEYAAPK